MAYQMARVVKCSGITATVNITPREEILKKMDTISLLMNHQLTERDVILYLLVENSGLSNRKIGEALGISHTSVASTHKAAKSKLAKQADAGFFQTKLN